MIAENVLDLRTLGATVVSSNLFVIYYLDEPPKTLHNQYLKNKEEKITRQLWIGKFVCSAFLVDKREYPMNVLLKLVMV